METDNDMSAHYESVVEALVGHFTRIDKAADTLPPFTAMPLVWLFLATLSIRPESLRVIRVG